LKAIEECDVIICSLAEHNRSYSAAFKNVFDWASRINVKVFQDKPMFLMSTSPGGYGGGNVMNTAKIFFPSFGADIKETFRFLNFMKILIWKAESLILKC
jgi:NAD(P)H-dependent FMN reductase